MKDEDKTKEQLVNELAELRQRIAELEASETERKRVEEALRESEEKWRSLAENAPNFVAIVDRDFIIQFINRTQPGVAVEEVVGRSMWDFIQPEYHDVARESVERVFQTGETGFYESVGGSPDLPRVYYENYLGPIKHNDQVVCVVYISIDITERVRAEEDLRRLYEQAQRDAETKATVLDEVNHRVKNNLLAIVGLLYAERRYAERTDQAAYRAITQNLMNRVGGLTTVHSLLAASDWAPLLLSDLAGQVVHSSLQMLPRHKGISVEVPPSPVRVTPDQAHSLALVINELATNTVKHALEERDTAHIAIRIALEDEDDTVRFEFRDDGPGYPEDVLQLERYRVGFDLIQNMVRTGLRGEVSLRNDDGAVAVIRFKAQA